jgi:hypothetical protein
MEEELKELLKKQFEIMLKNSIQQEVFLEELNKHLSEKEFNQLKINLLELIQTHQTSFSELKSIIKEI